MPALCRSSMRALERNAVRRSSTSYVDEPFGNLTQVTDAAGNVTTSGYDTRGRKTSSSDPDMGSWTYSYTVLDQLKSQTDAAAQTTTVTYDLLGRVTQRVEPDLTSNWTYDTAMYGVGKPATAATNTGYSRAHTYDNLGRSWQTSLTIDGNVYTSTTGYDGASRVSSITYPSGFAVDYVYNTYGYQTLLTDSSSGLAYWTANARDARNSVDVVWPKNSHCKTSWAVYATQRGLAARCPLRFWGDQWWPLRTGGAHGGAHGVGTHPRAVSA